QPADRLRAHRLRGVDIPLPVERESPHIICGRLVGVPPGISIPIWRALACQCRESCRRSPNQKPLPALGRGLVPLAAGLGGLALGGLPVWIYAAGHGAANLLVYVSQLEVSPAVSGAA